MDVPAEIKAIWENPYINVPAGNDDVMSVEDRLVVNANRIVFLPKKHDIMRNFTISGQGIKKILLLDSYSGAAIFRKFYNNIDEVVLNIWFNNTIPWFNSVACQVDADSDMVTIDYTGLMFRHRPELKAIPHKYTFEGVEYKVDDGQVILTYN